MKQIKRNKSKVWRKCYGKPFIARKAIAIAQMAIVTAQVSATVSVICSAHGNLAMQAVATAKAMINFTKAANNSSHQINKGFCK